MKKTLVLAMAMALGVTASAYAANPFSDVPAGHWAYDSISKLAAAGVIEGYGDDTFRGDRLMTRYEMAQIVAKAMSKGANVNKLAAEFADELDALGVRVAALEKKSDNVKITGFARYRWGIGTAAPGGNSKQRYHRLRSRLYFNGQINDTWKYTGMLQNEQRFDNDTGDERTDFQRAFVTGRVGGIKVMAGRNNLTLFNDGDVYDHRADYIQASYGAKLNISGWYGKLTPGNGGQLELDRLNATNSISAGAKLAYDVDKFGAWVEYGKFSSKHSAVKNNTREILGVGAYGKFGDLTADAKFLHGKIKNANGGKKNGWTIGLSYKGAKKDKVGSWGLGAKYYDMGNHTYMYDTVAGSSYQTWDAFSSFTQPEGFKGYKINATYTVAKNMVTELQYYDLKGKGAAATKERTFVADLYFYF